MTEARPLRTVVWRARARPLVAALACLSCGCVSYPLLGGATTVPAKGWEVAAGVGFVGPDRMPNHPYPTPVNFDLLGRYGLTDRLDIGLELMTEGAAVEARFQVFHCAPDEWPCLSALVAFTPGVRVGNGARCPAGFCAPTPWELLLFGEVRVLVGVRVHWFEVVLGPHAVLELPHARGYRPEGKLGGDLALVAHLAKGWRVGPEVVVLGTPSPDELGNLIGRVEWDVQAGLAVFKVF